MKELNQAYRLLLNEDDEGALGAFQSIAGRYPDAFAGTRALVFVDRILERLGRDAKENLNATMRQRPNSKIAAAAKSLLVSHLVKDGDYGQALTNALALFNNDDTWVVKHALYNAGNIAWYRQSDKSKGEEYLRKLIAEYPGDPLSISAQATLGQWTGESSPQPQTASEAWPENDGLVLQNYPNPFNPSTVIHFNVPQDGFVSLKVFDILGREVAALVNEQRVAGLYQINLNAATLPTGVYLYKLETGGKVAVQKMIIAR